ncbi:leucine-rich repeat-containing protein 71 isoform X2 [Melanotaenia boesemani]|uniref:leucine-rich repeat-containing protein 71 isoform X2 n=1 Tax=Melanotaenia boesemani TaxID=1250792 RepID=UPI001C0458D2|nr:leucine-rich repeat-containing protein 71 isoform X2 [Melanotaenia boesemani]
MPRKRSSREKTNIEDESVKNKGPTPEEALPAQTINDYRCSGNVQIDFPALCAFLDMKNIPTVCITETEDTDDNQSQIKNKYLWCKPRLTVKLETEDPHSATKIKISGWKVNEQIFQVLQIMLPSMSQLASLQFWQTGLTDPMVISLMNTLSLCSSLRSVTLEGNALPEQSFHLLLSETSVLTHLSLRNNQIGDEGAHLIGLALSNTRSANKNLLSLNLAFNSIGDAGARHVAQGLRFNRTLVFLSLSNNQIGDSGAAHLATVLGEFSLNHEEVKERRKLLLQRTQTSRLGPDPEQLCGEQLVLGALKRENKTTPPKKVVSRKDEKSADNKEKSNKKSTDSKVTQSKNQKPGGKEKQLPTQEAELVGIVNPLLDPSVHCRDGQLFFPGNKTLASLNLAGNRITEKSLLFFLRSLEIQDAEGGLLRLCLQRNHFSSECDSYMKIKELMASRNNLEPLRSLIKNDPETREQEGQVA